MDGSDTHDKASWSKAMLHTFCNICITAIERGMRPNTHFDKAGWKFVVQSFKDQTGLSLSKSQLKNKWDGIKKDWRVWKKLITETGVGWSTELGTISATDEWWQSKIQEMRGAKKFRHVGIEPSLCAKYDIMFTNIVATGQYAWTPSQGLLSDEDNVTAGMRNTTNEDTNMEEGSGDSEEDAIPDFTRDVSNMVGGSNVAHSCSNLSSSKRKGAHQTTPQSRKKKRGTGMGAVLVARMDKLVETVSMPRGITAPCRDKKGCSIEEVMEELHSIDGVTFGSALHTFATKFFCARSKREMWAAMGCIDRKVSWLKIMFDQHRQT
ncbi:L10-interacting MYB domain-containing protein-like [Populus nigra]|uniref:L10-interacting MYB domain-containing protein-like n=1 Tax=Populus nigra TaxID=3691 RepID=UPI002B275D09|nr:L10-interacting MYB domain-containing protein-like [Populus nigra]